VIRSSKAPSARGRGPVPLLPDLLSVQRGSHPQTWCMDRPGYDLRPLIHESDEIRQAPLVKIYGSYRYYDPVENNDFWWEKSSRQRVGRFMSETRLYENRPTRTRKIDKEICGGSVDAL